MCGGVSTSLNEGLLFTINKSKARIRTCAMSNSGCNLLKRMTNRSKQLNKTEKLSEWIE